MTVASLRRLKSRVGWINPRNLQTASTVPTEEPATLNVWGNHCGCYAFGCKCEIVAIRGSIGWLAVYSYLSSVPFFYLFLACDLCHPFLFDVLLPCSLKKNQNCWRFVDVPLIFSCPADHVLPGWQPHIFLGKVEVRSINLEYTYAQREGEECRRVTCANCRIYNV